MLISALSVIRPSMVYLFFSSFPIQSLPSLLQSIALCFSASRTNCGTEMDDAEKREKSANEKRKMETERRERNVVEVKSSFGSEFWESWSKKLNCVGRAIGWTGQIGMEWQTMTHYEPQSLQRKCPRGRSARDNESSRSKWPCGRDASEPGCWFDSPSIARRILSLDMRMAKIESARD